KGLYQGYGAQRSITPEFCGEIPGLGTKPILFIRHVRLPTTVWPSCSRRGAAAETARGCLAAPPAVRCHRLGRLALHHRPSLGAVPGARPAPLVCPVLVAARGHVPRGAGHRTDRPVARRARPSTRPRTSLGLGRPPACPAMVAPGQSRAGPAAEGGNPPQPTPHVDADGPP